MPVFSGGEGPRKTISNGFIAAELGQFCMRKPRYGKTEYDQQGAVKKCPKANRDESREGKRLCLFCNKDKNTYFQAKKGITIRPADKALRTKSWTGNCQISPNLRLYSIGLKP